MFVGDESVPAISTANILTSVVHPVQVRLVRDVNVPSKIYVGTGRAVIGTGDKILSTKSTARNRTQVLGSPRAVARNVPAIGDAFEESEELIHDPDPLPAQSAEIRLEISSPVLAGCPVP